MAKITDKLAIDIDMPSCEAASKTSMAKCFGILGASVVVPEMMTRKKRSSSGGRPYYECQTPEELACTEVATVFALSVLETIECPEIQHGPYNWLLGSKAGDCMGTQIDATIDLASVGLGSENVPFVDILEQELCYSAPKCRSLFQQAMDEAPDGQCLEAMDEATKSELIKCITNFHDATNDKLVCPISWSPVWNWLADMVVKRADCRVEIESLVEGSPMFDLDSCKATISGQDPVEQCRNLLDPPSPEDAVELEEEDGGKRRRKREVPSHCGDLRTGGCVAAFEAQFKESTTATCKGVANSKWYWFPGGPGAECLTDPDIKMTIKDCPGFKDCQAAMKEAFVNIDKSDMWGGGMAPPGRRRKRLVFGQPSDADGECYKHYPSYQTRAMMKQCAKNYINEEGKLQCPDEIPPEMFHLFDSIANYPHCHGDIEWMYGADSVDEEQCKEKVNKKVHMCKMLVGMQAEEEGSVEGAPLNTPPLMSPPGRRKRALPPPPGGGGQTGGTVEDTGVPVDNDLVCPTRAEKDCDILFRQVLMLGFLKRLRQSAC